MSDAGFIIGSYVLVLGTMAAGAVLIVTRGRRLARRVPDEEKPWT